MRIGRVADFLAAKPAPAWFDTRREITTKSSLGVAHRDCQQEIPGRPVSDLGGVTETLGRLAHYGNEHEEKA